MMIMRVKLKLDEYLFIFKCMISFNCFNMKYNFIVLKMIYLGEVV